MRASTASNILMNIPLTAPTAFQPGNILCSSTPIKPKGSRHPVARASMQELHLDPNETPIKGHGVKRKTKPLSASSSSSSVTKPQIRKPSATVASRLSVVRHVPPTPAADPVRLAGQQRPLEDSDSGHTDSDSCNVSEKRKVKTKTDIPVIKSTDTENDFATTDFNNEVEMNDLNRTGGNNSAQVGSSHPTQSVSVLRNPGVHLSSSGHPLPVVDDQEYSSPGPHRTSQQRGTSPQRGNSPQGPSRPSPPILRKKIYTDPTTPSSSSPATDTGQKKLEIQVRNLPLNNNFVTNPNNNVPRVSEVSQNGSSSSRTENSGKPVLRHSPVSLESFADDLLFDGPNPSSPSQRTPRTPGTGELNSLVLGLSRGQLKTPQDPSVDPVLPAVMTAKSSDLTTFSQRSPGRFGRYNPNPPPPPPPFALNLVNPTESRPKILRTPPPSPPAHQDHVEYYSPPQPYRDRTETPPTQQTRNQSPYERYDKRRIPTPKEIPVEDARSKDGRYTPGSGDGYGSYNNSGNSGVSSTHHGQYPGSKSEHNIDDRHPPGQNNLDGMNYERVDSESRERQFERQFEEFYRQEEKLSLVDVDPLSTNDWYSTPANHAVHIHSSVQKSSSNLDYHLHSPPSGLGNPGQEPPEKPLEADKDMNHKFDSDLSEFLPIQKRSGYYDDRPASSRKDVASRLRSVFFKDSVENPQERSNSVPSPVSKSSVSSTEYRTNKSTQNKFRPKTTQDKERITEDRSGVYTTGTDPTPSNRFTSPALKTEKLEGGGRTGSAFLPIHPQPVTATAPVTKQRLNLEKLDLAEPAPQESDGRVELRGERGQQEDRR